MTAPTAAEKLTCLAEAVVLFHSGKLWTEDDTAQWRRLTGTDRASTRSLCDFARSCLKDGYVEGAFYFVRECQGDDWSPARCWIADGSLWVLLGEMHCQTVHEVGQRIILPVP